MTTDRAPRPAPPGPAPAAPDPVGVVVITRNRGERLLHTLDRLAALPERPPVVVVDNASTDGSAHAVRTAHPEVRMILLPRNEGAAARNRGVRALRTPYVAFSDDDSWWQPGALARAAELFAAHPRLGLIAAATRVGPDQAPDPLNEVLADSPLGTAPDLPGPSVLGFLACAGIVRRSAFLEAGGFHPLLHLGGEETLLALDLAARGWGVAHCPGVTAHHHPDPGPRPGRAARMRRNELLTAWLRRPWPRAAAATARLAAACPASGEARRALREAVPLLPTAVRHRRTVPDWLERDLRALDGG
ncbi:glycosyltransferase [Streptomyces capparidis]